MRFGWGGSMRGFTLLELLVVLVIVIMMITLVPPLVSGLSGTTELRGAARQLAAGLRAARNQAITVQRESVLVLDMEQRRFRVTGDARQYPLPDGIGLKLFTAQSERLNDTVGTIRFFPDGGSTGGRITLTGKHIEYLVDVDWLTGRIQILDREIQ